MSSDVGAFVRDLDYADLPADVVAQAQRCLLDLIGVAAAGSTSQLSKITRDHAANYLRGDVRRAGLLFDGRQVSPVGAALANAASVDAMDGHDGHRLAKGHAGAAVVPAALALLGDDASGRDLIAGMVVGYEVAIRAAIALHGTATDYHSSGAWNALGAAAAAARILRLDRREVEEALGIAEYHGPRAPMMRCIDHPSMVKDSSAWGSCAGISAALLAADGFTGAPASVLTARPELWSDLGQRWTVLEQYFKPYPVCRWAQPAVVGVLSLLRGRDVRAADIRHIKVATFDPATRLQTRLPDTTEAAQYSLPFAVAMAAVQGDVTPAAITHPARAGHDVRRLSTGLTVVESPDMTAVFPATRLAAVTVTMADGRELSSGPVTAPGDSDRPFTQHAIEGKFRAWSTPVLGAPRAGALIHTVAGIAGLSMAELARHLYPPVSTGVTDSRPPM